MTTPTSVTALDALTSRPLWPHQVKAFEAVRDQRQQLIDADMGGRPGGKTACAIALLEHDLRAAREVRYAPVIGERITHDWPFRVLVLAPKSVLGVWPNQIAEHATSGWTTWNGEVRGRNGKPLRNPSVTRRAEALVQATVNAGKLRRPFMAVVGYEASWQGDMAKLLLGTPWDAVILDESHRLKSAGGKASKHAAQIAARVRARGGRVLALDRHAHAALALDIWAQARALDGGAALGTSYHRFCTAFGRGDTIWAPGPKGPVQRVVYKGIRDDRMDDFTQRVRHLIHRIPREGLDAYLGLPDAVDVYRTIDLDPATRRAYESLEKDLIARVGDGAVTAANAMVLVLRLAQVASGYAPTITADGTSSNVAWRLFDHPSLPEKARLLLDVLEDLPLREPVVVFCRFHHDLDAVARVAKMQGRSYGELSGRRRDGLTDHGTMADVDVLGAQIKSGGVGIDLTRARYGIYYTLGFELADYLQSRKRLHRPGQTRPVTYVHLLAENTVESSIYGALRNRQQVVDTVLQCLGGGTR
jgi:SNF2 family DNA or RNA helicase